MPVPVAVVLTVCFGACAAYAVVRLRAACHDDRLRYACHGAMAVAMLVMVWLRPPAPVAIVGAAGFVVLAGAVAVQAHRRRHWQGVHHVAMAVAMAVMWLAMVPGTGHAPAHQHGPVSGPAPLSLSQSVLLLVALLLAPAGAAWLASRVRERWFEAAAALGMALGAAAMAIAH